MDVGDVLAFVAIGIIAMTAVGGFCAFVLSFRFGPEKARLLAIAFTAAISLPVLIEGTLLAGIIGAVLALILICVVPPDNPDAD